MQKGLVFVRHCCSASQCVAVCCSVLHGVAMCCNPFRNPSLLHSFAQESCLCRALLQMRDIYAFPRQHIESCGVSQVTCE